MMRRTFLKLAAFLGFARPAAEARALQSNELPWYPNTPIRGNLAVGNLRENLLAGLKTERGVHAETLATGIGVIVGFAALNAALTRAAETTKVKGAVIPKQDLLLAGGADGKRYIFGNLPNNYLYGDLGKRLNLLALMRGALRSVGAPDPTETELKTIIQRIANSIGGKGFGISEVPAPHQPSIQPAEILKLVWPFARNIFEMPLPATIKSQEPPLDENHWPVVASLVATQFLDKTQKALEPKIFFTLVFEAAIIAAKIDPEEIDRGRWRFEAAGGELRVLRLNA